MTNNASHVPCLPFRTIHTALIGHVGQTYGTKYPIDIQCDNGIIHTIPTVLTPGYYAAGAEDQLTTRRPDMDKLNGSIS